MKKKISILIIACLIISKFSLPVSSLEKQNYIPVPDVGAESCILIDASTNKIIYEKNADKKQYPASTTKILTAALAIEMGFADKTTQVSRNAVRSIGINGSNVGLKAGEKIGFINLLEMALISSANDAAGAIAEGVSGSISSFAGLMNSKARQLGLVNTTFYNPIGLDVEDGFPNHLTTARELAQIMRYATTFDLFRYISGNTGYFFPVTNLHGKARYFESTNQLLVDSDYKSDNYTIVAGKTGMTKAAKNVFAVCARNNEGIELILVLMKHPYREAMFKDAKKMLDYGFEMAAKDTGLAVRGFYDVRLRPSQTVVDDFYHKGYVMGYPGGKFNYAENVARDTFVKVLEKVRGNSGSAIYDLPYIKNAISGGLFHTDWQKDMNKPITRGEAIVIMDSLLNIGLNEQEISELSGKITDYDEIPEGLRPSVMRVYKTGIIKGCGDGSVNMDMTLTREQMVIILDNYLKYSGQILMQSWMQLESLFCFRCG